MVGSCDRKAVPNHQSYRSESWLGTLYAFVVSTRDTVWACWAWVCQKSCCLVCWCGWHFVAVCPSYSQGFWPLLLVLWCQVPLYICEYFSFCCLISVDSVDDFSCNRTFDWTQTSFHQHQLTSSGLRTTQGAVTYIVAKGYATHSLVERLL